MKPGFVVLTDAAPDILTDIRYYSTYNFTGRRVTGYDEPLAIVTEKCAAALADLSRLAKERGYRFKVFDAYRPASAVKSFVDWTKTPGDEEMKPFFFPDTEKPEIIPLGYISANSSHCSGSTVDMTLFDMKTGRELDMGTPFDYFDPRSHHYCTEGLTEKQIENRAILDSILLDNGFKTISTEWWHFTLIDEPYPDVAFDFPVSRFAE